MLDAPRTAWRFAHLGDAVGLFTDDDNRVDAQVTSEATNPLVLSK